jgi:hypothetical protein
MLPAQFGKHCPQMLDLDLLGSELGGPGGDRCCAGGMLCATFGALGNDQRLKRSDIVGKIVRISDHME